MALTNNSAAVVQATPKPTTSYDLSGALNQFQTIAGNNSSASAKQAEELRRWQEQQALIARNFNASEAQKNRVWQERMSNTAHQREVNDLVAAGLNPVLSAMGGNGAAVTSGATASSSVPSGAKGDVDFSATSAMASLLGAILRLEGTRVSAQANEAVADKYTAMSKYTAELDAQTRLTTTNIQAMATKYVSDNNLAGTKYASDKSAAAQQIVASIHAAAQKYGYDLNAMTSKQIAAFNADVNKELQSKGFDHEIDVKTMLFEQNKEILSMFPSSGWQYDPWQQNVREWIDTITDGIGSVGKLLGR